MEPDDKTGFVFVNVSVYLKTVNYMYVYENYVVRGKLLRCSGCQYVQYCNRECQKAAWTDHKIECTCLKKVAPRIVPDAARLMARIIFKLKVTISKQL